MKYLIIIGLFFLSLADLGHCMGITGELRQIGQGQAYYLGFIKVYEATLFGERQTAAQNILSPTASKCLRLDYAVEVGRQDFIEAAKTVLARQYSEQQLAQVQPDVATLHSSYQDVQEGDSYLLCYDSQSGQTTLSLNRKPVVTLNSPEFAAIYFGIWLGEQAPLDQKLRKDLLAGLSSP